MSLEFCTLYVSPHTPWNSTFIGRNAQLNSFITTVPIIYWYISIDLLCKSMSWFLYGAKLRHKRVKMTEGDHSFLFWKLLCYERNAQIKAKWLSMIGYHFPCKFYFNVFRFVMFLIYIFVKIRWYIFICLFLFMSKVLSL